MDISKLKLNIVEDAYRAAAGEIDWHAFMQNFEQFSAVKTTMSSHDDSYTNIDAFFQVNYDPDYVNSFVQHYCHLNPWVELINTFKDRHEGGWGHPTVPVASLVNTEFYQDWLLPQGKIADGYGINLAHSSNHSVSLLFNFAPDHIQQAQQIEHIMLDVGNHVRRAIELHRKLEGKRLLVNNYENVLNCLQNAVLITDDQQRLVFANSKAEAILRSEELLFFDSSSRLRFLNFENQNRLEQSMAPSNGHHTGAMPFSIPLQGAKSNKYYLFVAPLMSEPSEQDDINHLWKKPRQFSWFLVKPDETQPLKADIAQTLLGISPTEARIALSLLENKTLAEYADLHKVSIKTVRTQSKSLLSKTGCRRQAELVAKLNRLFTHFKIE